MCYACTTMNARAAAVSQPLVRHEPVPCQLSPEEGQQLVVVGCEYYWGKPAVRLDWTGPDAVLGVRYVGVVTYSWQPWAMPFTSALPTQPSAGQALKVTAVKSRVGNTRVRLDFGRDDAGNTFYQADIYACYLSQFHTNRVRA